MNHYLKPLAVLLTSAFITGSALAATTNTNVENAAVYLNAIEPKAGAYGYGQGPDMDMDLNKKLSLEFSKMNGTGQDFRNYYADNPSQSLDGDRPGVAVGLRMRYLLQ